MKKMVNAIDTILLFLVVFVFLFAFDFYKFPVWSIAFVISVGIWVISVIVKVKAVKDK
ncbi:hypothetical protein Q9306_08475 [Bacillus sp. WLY-B-L8]|nr:hypothetical protein [Bacillus sp. WLY-B-L8]